MRNHFTKEQMRNQHKAAISRILTQYAGDRESAIESLTDYVMKRIALVIAAQRTQQEKRDSRTLRKEQTNAADITCRYRGV